MQDVATDVLDQRSSRGKGLRETIWTYLRRQWTGAFRVELTSSRSLALFRRSCEQSVEEIAAQTFQLLQQVPDTCEDPQTVLFRLARTVVERNQGQVRPVAIQSRVAAEALLKREIEGFDRETRKLLGMHVFAGMSYQQIAAQLGMPPAHVLRILTKAYSHLRLRTEPVDSSPVSSKDFC